MLKLVLTYNQQTALMEALRQLDMHEIVAGDKSVNVPYKLGPERRTLVKNMRAIQNSISVWQETVKGIFKEFFPDVPDGAPVMQKDRPDDFAKYQSALMASAQQSDEVELIPFSEKVMYEDNEFPASALELLEKHNLIEDVVVKPHLREVK